MEINELERELRGALRETLDRQLGPDPDWTASPAARSVAALERPRSRWPFRVLAAAALVGAGGAVALLAGAPKPDPNVRVEAANGWIAFSVSQPGPTGAEEDLDIWLVALGQDARRVVGTDSDRVKELCPAFAPDGRRLAYGRVEGQGTQHVVENGVEVTQPAAYRRSELAIADVSHDGRVADPVTIPVGDDLPPPCPVWSPAGDQVAFGVPRTSPINPTQSGEGSEVWVVRLADRHINVVPDLLATDIEWSPDGSVLAIVGGVETDSGPGVTGGLQDARVHLYTPATGNLRALDETLGVTRLAWSPDGRRIAYEGGLQTAPRNEGRGALWLIDVQSGQPEVLTEAYAANHGIGPIWSPDGATIAYQRRVGSERHEVVLVMPGQRSEVTGHAREIALPVERMADDGSIHELFPYRVTWSPDGRYLLYLAWTFPAAGSEQTVIAAVPIDADAPATFLDAPSGVAPYDGYDDTTFVPIQVWGRDLSQGSTPGVAGMSPSGLSGPGSAGLPANPAPTQDLIDAWLDTSTWNTEVSERYGFTIGHPEAWTVIESAHDWDQATDSINNDSGGMEVFVAPDESIYLAAWSADVEPATTMARWVQALCDQYVGSCTDIQAMSEPAFANASDREGILFGWDDGMTAFIPSWYDNAKPGSIWEQPAPEDGRIYIVESGRPASGPYHARALIEAFTSSLCIGCVG